METSIFLPSSAKSFSGETITVIVKANSLEITDEKGNCIETVSNPVRLEIRDRQGRKTSQAVELAWKSY